MTIEIRPLTPADIPAITAIHEGSAPERSGSLEWVKGNAWNYPRMQYFVAESPEKGVLGFILWNEKSGFRADAVMELEQIAVRPEHQNQGIGEALIRQSLLYVSRHLSARSNDLRSVLATTSIDNLVAQRLYIRVLGAEIVATIPSLFQADEVVLLSRDPLGAVLAEPGDCALTEVA